MAKVTLGGNTITSGHFPKKGERSRLPLTARI